MIEQQRFDQLIGAIEGRNNVHLNEIQPRIADTGINETYVTQDQVKEILGELVFGRGMSSAQSLREHVEGETKSLPDLQKNLRDTARELFPDAKFVLCSFKEVTA